MTFLSPLWLVALLPWAAFAVWMLVGRRRRIRVPFLPLWNVPEELRRPKKGFEPPPVSLLFALLATLLALLAAARPRLSFRDNPRHLAVLLDRGAGMSASAPDGRPRFVAAADALAEALSARPEPLRLTLVDVPVGDRWSGPPGALPAAVAARRRTAVDTRDDLRAVLADPAWRGQPVVVISDHDLGPTDPNVIPIHPAAPVRNVGRVALAERPGQVMVTVSATEAARRTLVLRSGDRSVRQDVDLPTAGERNVFVDLSTPAELIEASLEGGDDFPADDRAWLVRGRHGAVVEPRAPVADELRRMIDVYQRHRPAGESSTRVAVARPGELEAGEPGVILAPAVGGESPPGEIRASPHPVTAGVDWDGLAQGAALTRSAPPEGWTILARAGERAVLAARDGDPRQLWVGFESRPFARTPGFVVLWTNVFDWLGAGGQGFAATTLAGPTGDARRLLPDPLPPGVDPRRWPGVFESPAGKVAINPGRTSFSPGRPTDDWPVRLAALPISPAAGVDAGPWLALAALACLALAAATWERRRRAIPHPDPVRASPTT